MLARRPQGDRTMNYSLPIAVIATAMVSSCPSWGIDEINLADKTPVTIMDKFTDGLWLMHVDCECQRGMDVTSRCDYEDEKCCTPVLAGAADSVFVSDQAFHIAFRRGGSEYTRSSVNDSCISYMSEGGPGERFRVWISGMRLRAESSIHYSGVPIISSMRGYLERAQ